MKILELRTSATGAKLEIHRQLARVAVRLALNKTGVRYWLLVQRIND